MSDYNFSVIIPTINTNNYLLKCLTYLERQSYKNFEVIIISENKLENILEKNYSFKLRIINKKISKPGEKRNYAAKISEGEYLCFIDDDAYPKQDWLECAKNTFTKYKNKKILLGGPGILPDDENFFSKISDLFFTSIFLGSSKARYMSVYKLDKHNFDDWPSVNLILSKQNFLHVNGFDVNFWPGEDSKLCSKLLSNGINIIYDPKLIVYHYRRSNFIKHFRQVFRYSFHRGIFFQSRDNNSFKLKYTMPSVFLVYLILMPFLSSIKIYLIPLYSFIILLIFDFLVSFKKEKNILVLIVSRVVIFLSIICYGAGFYYSFFRKKTSLGLGR